MTISYLIFLNYISHILVNYPSSIIHYFSLLKFSHISSPFLCKLSYLYIKKKLSYLPYQQFFFWNPFLHQVFIFSGNLIYISFLVLYNFLICFLMPVLSMVGCNTWSNLSLHTKWKCLDLLWHPIHARNRIPNLWSSKVGSTYGRSEAFGEKNIIYIREGL